MKFFNAFCIIVLSAIILTGCSRKFKMPRDAESPESNWQFSRQNIESTASLKSDFSGNLKLLWEKNAPDNPAGPLAIGAGNLILGGSKGRICFYDLESGKYKGRINSKRGIQTGIIVIDSLAYYGIGHSRNRFVCLNLHNRKQVWSLPIKDVTGSPIILDKQLFVISALGEVYSLDQISGEIIWKDTLGARCLAGPSGYAGTVYFPCDDGNLVAFEASTGNRLFISDLGEPLVNKSVIGKYVFISGSEGSFYAIEQKTGQIVWTKNFNSPIWTSPALDDGILFFGDNGGILRAISEMNGEIIWEFKSKGVILSSPIIVGDYVIFGSLDRNLYCLEKKTGRLTSKREFQNDIIFPAVSDGQRICVAMRGGAIQCFGD